MHQSINLGIQNARSRLFFFLRKQKPHAKRIINFDELLLIFRMETCTHVISHASVIYFILDKTDYYYTAKICNKQGFIQVHRKPKHIII